MLSWQHRPRVRALSKSVLGVAMAIQALSKGVLGVAMAMQALSKGTLGVEVDNIAVSYTS